MDPEVGKDANGQGALAPFISKLQEILQAPNPADCIKWGPTSDTIIVINQSKFAREVLPRYFKHDNIRSFIRQLNIYGFQRCRNPERAGSVEGEHGELEFYHEHFREGRKDLMRLISRGIPSHKRSFKPGEGFAPLPPPLPPTVHLPNAPPLNLSSDAQQLASEMTWVHKHIASVDSQLRSQAHHVQSRLTTLVEVLAASHGATAPASAPQFRVPSLAAQPSPTWSGGAEPSADDAGRESYVVDVIDEDDGEEKSGDTSPSDGVDHDAVHAMANAVADTVYRDQGGNTTHPVHVSADGLVLNGGGSAQVSGANGHAAAAPPLIVTSEVE